MFWVGFTDPDWIEDPDRYIQPKTSNPDSNPDPNLDPTLTAGWIRSQSKKNVSDPQHG